MNSWNGRLETWSCCDLPLPVTVILVTLRSVVNNGLVSTPILLSNTLTFNSFAAFKTDYNIQARAASVGVSVWKVERKKETRH